MYQTDQATAATSLPAPAAAGTQGYFTNGNPASGVAPTIVDADWLNMIQQELINVVLAAGGTPSKTTYTQVRDAIKTMYGTGRLLNVQVFTSSGTYTSTPGTNSIIVEGAGAGAPSGGTVATTSSQNSIGTPGGAGAYAKARFTSGFTGGVPVTIGSSPAPGSGSGANGGITSFGSLMSLPGGTGGVVGSTTASAVLTPPVAATSAPTITGAAQILASITGDGGTYGSCLTPTSSTVIAGHGGNSPLGNGGAAGANASGYGAGGGGIAQGASGAAQNGKSGTQGIIFVYEYA